MKSQTIDRISSNHLSVQDFINCYESKNIPLIISDIPKNDNWLSWTEVNNSWSIENLKNNYGDQVFKCGEDDDGYPIKVKMKYYMKYVQNTKADSPLYVFDSKFDTRTPTATIGNEYIVPKYFKDDLFKFAGERRRPPYKWLLVGPQRSGTCSHIDPLATSAWNTLISGRKFWAVFPPNVTKEFAKCKKYIKKNEDDEAINYFVDHLKRLKQAYIDDSNGQKGVHSESFNSNYPCPFVEFIQEPGDTVYVPGGWWHAVLNVEDSIAITQNFCSKQNFNEVWLQTRTGRVKMAQKWLKTLKAMGGDHAALAHRAIELNIKDNFKFETKTERIERKRLKEEQKKMKKERKEKEKEKEKLKQQQLLQQQQLLLLQQQQNEKSDKKNKNKKKKSSKDNQDIKDSKTEIYKSSLPSTTITTATTGNTNSTSSSPITTEETDSLGSMSIIGSEVLLEEDHHTSNNKSSSRNSSSKKSNYPRDWKDKFRCSASSNQKKKKKKVEK